MFIQIEPNDEMKKIVEGAKTYANTSNAEGWVWIDGSINGNNNTVVSGWGYIGESREQFIPVKIIYNPPTTICIFPDNEKIIVRCSEGEIFSEEQGVMAAIVKKIFKSRNAFKKLVNSGQRQTVKEEKETNLLSPGKKIDLQETEDYKKILLEREKKHKKKTKKETDEPKTSKEQE